MTKHHLNDINFKIITRNIFGESYIVEKHKTTPLIMKVKKEFNEKGLWLNEI